MEAPHSKSHHPAMFSGHRHCGSGHMMFLVVEGQDSAYPHILVSIHYFNPPALFIAFACNKKGLIIFLFLRLFFFLVAFFGRAGKSHFQVFL